MKRFLILGLLCLLASFLRVSAQEDKYYKINGAWWGFDKNAGEITFIPYDWPGGKIPSKIEGVPVRAIGGDNSWPCSNYNGKRNHITQIIIPDGVKSIGKDAFAKLNIRELVVPEGVESIGRNAFYGCGRLERVSLPASLRSVGDRAFLECPALESVTYAGRESDISFGRNVFKDCLWLHPDFSEPFRSSKYYQRLMQVERTGNPAADAIAIAASQEGYHEGDSFQDLYGGNTKGRNDYTEYNYLFGAPDWLWRPGLAPVGEYGGWCGQFCGWCLAMAGIPDAAHQYRNDDEDEDHIQWEKTRYAGGYYEIKPGDVLHLRAGHYALVKTVSTKGNTVVVGTWNGNPEVEWIVREFNGADGKNLNYVSGSSKYDCMEILQFLPSVLDTLPQYTLRFDPAGGSTPVTRRQIYYGANYGLLPVPSKAGATFDGWYTARQGGKKITSYRKAFLEGDQTLYAHWSQGGAAAPPAATAHVQDDPDAVESDGYTASIYFKRLCDVDLTGDFRKDMIAVALSQTGYHEGNSEADYGGGNSRGNQDFSEYGRFLESSGNAWCSEFGTWCVRMSGLPEDILRDSRGANAGRFTKGTPSRYYRWSELSFAGGDYTPREGDILLWAWDLDEHEYDKSLGHTAIFRRASVQGNKVTLYTVEGNDGNKVTEDYYTVRKSDGVLTDDDGRLYFLVAPDYENRSIERHQVRFDPAGGTVRQSAKTVADGGLFGPLPIPERQGDTFLGWYTEPSGGIRINMYHHVRLDGDLTLYAHWSSGPASPAGTGTTRAPQTQTTQTQTAPAGTSQSAPAAVRNKVSDWAALEVGKAAGLGLVPSELRSAYGQDITREEFCHLMIRLVNKALDTDVTLLFTSSGKLDRNAFSDTDDPGVLSALALGIIQKGNGGRFNPRNPVSKQDAAAMLARTAQGLELKESEGTAIAKALEAQSSGNGFTREQAIVAALRLYNKTR